MVPEEFKRKLTAISREIICETGRQSSRVEGNSLTS